MADPSASGSPTGRRISWTARLLAPLALIATLLAVALVVSASMGDDDGSGGEAAQSAPATDKPEKPDESDDEGSASEETYAVESGDSLSTIAEKFDTTVEELEKLNPDVDSTTLIEGQELKIP